MANWLYEGVYDAEFVTWEVNAAFTREKVDVDATVAKVDAGTVLVNGDNSFRGILLHTQKKGRNGGITAIVRGQAIVILDLLIFPVVTNAVDGADAGSDNVAENAAATAALRTALLAQMKALGILARN